MMVISNSCPAPARRYSGRSNLSNWESGRGIHREKIMYWFDRKVQSGVQGLVNFTGLYPQWWSSQCGWVMGIATAGCYFTGFIASLALALQITMYLVLFFFSGVFAFTGFMPKKYFDIIRAGWNRTEPPSVSAALIFSVAGLAWSGLAGIPLAVYWFVLTLFYYFCACTDPPPPRPRTKHSLNGV